LLDLLDAQKMVAITSELTWLEVLTGPRRSGDQNLEVQYRSFLTSSAVMRIEPIIGPIIEKAIELRAAYGLKSPDALHISTGILAGCDLFVTRDLA